RADGRADVRGEIGRWYGGKGSACRKWGRGRDRQGVAVGYQAGFVRGLNWNAAGRWKPEGNRGAYLPRGDARNGRRALPLGSTTAKHDDQRQCRSDWGRSRWTAADPKIQGRRKEDPRHPRHYDRHLCAGRQKRDHAGNKNFHLRRQEAGGRNLSDPAHQLRQERPRTADVIMNIAG